MNVCIFRLQLTKPKYLVKINFILYDFKNTSDLKFP